MLIGREQETAFLENHFRRPGSQILVAYGQRGVGKTALLTAFTEKKRTFVLTADNCSAREQCFQWGEKLRSRGKEISQYPSWKELLEGLTDKKTESKAVLIIENFQYLIKGDPLFLQELIQFLKEQKELQLLVILSTWASGWVENSMISKVGNLAFSISGFLKVKELPFSVMRRIFSEYSLRECIDYYAALGGVPGLWKFLDNKISVEENLTAVFLHKNSLIPELMMKWSLEELREEAVYNTILATIADGQQSKLNDIYAHTGFNRAKISVYLKNLMELEIVEKVLPGTYEICNHFVRFCFYFLFPHRTAKYIRQEYPNFTQYAYRRICRELLQKRFRTVELWNVRQGKIYFLCKDDSGKKIVVDYSGTLCYTSKDYDMLQAAVKSVRLVPDEIIIFGENGYENALAGRVSEQVHFFSVDEES